MGRPSKFDDALADAICLKIADGKSLRAICEDAEFPTKTTVMRWLISKEEFRDHYREARDIQADGFFDEQIDIADEATPETANVAKLRIDARKWVMGRINAKKYGEKAAETHVNNTVNAFVVLPPEQLRELQNQHERSLAKLLSR